MPNWCSNTLIITGAPSEVTRFLATACRVDVTALDTVARASVLDHATGTPVSPEAFEAVRHHQLSAAVAQFSFEGHDPLPAALREDPLQRREADPARWDALEAAHGAGNWWYWNVQHWSTKWDANHPTGWFVHPGEARVGFATAWGPPVGWLATVAAAHPTLGLQLAYEVEGFEGHGLLTVDHTTRSITDVEVTAENAHWFWCEVLGFPTVPDREDRETEEDCEDCEDTGGVDGTAPTGPVVDLATF